MLRNDTIPRGCLPICKLQLPNPPAPMVTAWNSCLKDCGQQLIFIIIDYNNLNKFSELQELIDALVENAFNNIRAEFTSLPELESKLQSTLAEIKATNDKDLAELIVKLNKKRTNNTDIDTPSAKKQKNSPSPSELDVKSSEKCPPPLNLIRKKTRLPWPRRKIITQHNSLARKQRRLSTYTYTHHFM